MIDWITGKFWITHNPDVLRSGRSVRTKIIDGIETIEYDIANRLSIKGSHDANITIRSLTDNTVEISGNPAKFLQGHNVFGTNDLKYLVAKMIDKLCMLDELELKPTDIEYENIQSGIYSPPYLFPIRLLIRHKIFDHWHLMMRGCISLNYLKNVE